MPCFDYNGTLVPGVARDNRDGGALFWDPMPFQQSESRFLWRGSPPRRLKVLDDGMQAARLGSVSHAVTAPGLSVASDSAARGALASS